VREAEQEFELGDRGEGSRSEDGWRFAEARRGEVVGVSSTKTQDWREADQVEHEV